jgi:Bifunctional DNA primase/polymerase, N-terminal/YspA, cpYpsA-related SLOG family
MMGRRLQGLPRGPGGAVLAACACGAAIIWVDGPDGRHVALDAHPVPDGTWVLTPGQGKGRPARPLAAGERPPPPEARHTRHADTHGKLVRAASHGQPARPAGQAELAAPTTGFRALVTGSRAWADAAAVAAALEVLRGAHGDQLTVVHGGCPRGADAIADAWCRRAGVRAERWPAEWAAGRRAGMARNAAMVATGPDLCLAFIRDNSPGATHCADLAEKAGIPVQRHTAATPKTERAAPARRPGNPLLAAALSYAFRGWRVFPVIPGGKRPAFPDHTADRCDGRDPRCRNGHQGWEGRATTDLDRIGRAWTTAPYNIGIATGPSGLVVIDLDTPKPGEETPPPQWRLPGVTDGRDALAVLCERAGQPFPSDTYTVRTGRGGAHLYFRQPPGQALRNTQGAAGGLGWLVDTRAGGGYVVAGGSTVDGRAYTVVCDTEPAALPQWLALALKPAPLPPQRPVAVPVAADRRGAFLAAAVTGEVERVTSSPPDGHNIALYRAAVALGQLVAGGSLTEDDVTGWLADAAAQVGQRPGEATRTIRSGLQAGAKRPRTVAA